MFCVHTLEKRQVPRLLLPSLELPRNNTLAHVRTDLAVWQVLYFGLRKCFLFSRNYTFLSLCRHVDFFIVIIEKNVNL